MLAVDWCQSLPGHSGATDLGFIGFRARAFLARPGMTAERSSCARDAALAQRGNPNSIWRFAIPARSYYHPREVDCRGRVVNVALLPDECEVAVIGAGPYGLAVAAHLKAAGLGTRAFGDPMSSWRNSMPKGMKLLSPWSATHIADPAKRFSLDRFWHQ